MPRGFARASALTGLAPGLSPANGNLARTGLRDPDPMVRIGALDMLANVTPNQLLAPRSAAALRSQPRRAHQGRFSAGPSPSGTANQPTADREKFARAAAEFIAAQRLNADRPESRSTLGSFFAKRGDATDAEVEYKAALSLGSQYAPAAVNLADLYRALGREADGETVLRAAVAASPRGCGCSLRAWPQSRAE